MVITGAGHAPNVIGLVYVAAFAPEALAMALTQKPIAARCFDDKSGPPASKVKPSWYQVSANDRMKPKKTITLQASHASFASHGDDIFALIEEAAGAAGGKGMAA